MDTIYLIQNTRIPDQYKIGITGNWAQRSRQLEVGTKTTCITTARVNDPRSLEKHLHRRFSAERLPQSEWFHLSSSQLLFVQSAFRKAESDCQAAAVPAGAASVDALLQERHQESARRRETIRTAAAVARQEQDARDAARREREAAAVKAPTKWTDDRREVDSFVSRTANGVCKWLFCTFTLAVLLSAVHRKPLSIENTVTPPLVISSTWGLIVSAALAASKVKE